MVIALSRIYHLIHSRNKMGKYKYQEITNQYSTHKNLKREKIQRNFFMTTKINTKDIICKHLTNSAGYVLCLNNTSTKQGNP